MDTNKENELLQNLDQQTPPAQGAAASHWADGRPKQAGAVWAAANPPQPAKVGQQQASSQASQPAFPEGSEQVSPELVNKIEAYGAEAVYNAGAETGNN